MQGRFFRHLLPVQLLALCATFLLLSACGTTPEEEPDRACPQGCAPNEVCTSGDVCACATGFLDCDGNLSNGCEVQGSSCDTPCEPETDEAFCGRLSRNCGDMEAPDNCGSTRSANCGTCAGDEICGASVPNVCGKEEQPCEGETDAELCEGLSKNCGSLTTDDRCDVSRTVECGSCPEGDVCGENEPNVCGTPVEPCEPESDGAICARLGKNCGDVGEIDNCGAFRTASCGTCTGSAVCGLLEDNVCDTCPVESDATFCERHGKECGTFSGRDSCDKARTANCGACGEGEACGLETPFICSPIPCEPETDRELCLAQGKTCGASQGTDRCGNVRDLDCGGCFGGQICGSVQANVCGPDPSCTPDDDATVCASQGMDCGSVNAPDNCGAFRNLNCGTCGPTDRCGLYEFNVCGDCTETDEEFCARNLKGCGNFTGTDLCGSQRTVQCGDCGTGNVCSRNSCISAMGNPLNGERCVISAGNYRTCAGDLICIIRASDEVNLNACRMACTSDAECMYGACALGVLSDGRGICGTHREVGESCEPFYESDDICVPKSQGADCVGGTCVLP